MTPTNTRSTALCAALVIGLISAGCATGSSIKRIHKDSNFEPYQNILIAADGQVYENRATFERLLATRLSAEGYKVTPLYKIGGGNKPVNREALVAAVQKGGFDAILFSHPLTSDFKIAKKQGNTTVDPNRRSDSAINLFRYDYEENTTPDYESLATSAVILTALYAVDTEKKVWEARTDLAERDSAALVIDDAVKLLLAQIRRDKLFARSGQ